MSVNFDWSIILIRKSFGTSRHISEKLAVKLAIVGLNFYFVHHVIHTVFIHTSVNRIWSEAHRLILTISSLSCTFVNTECLRRWGNVDYFIKK